jgi:U3 small nucleolar RNA-associated protein 11
MNFEDAEETTQLNVVRKPSSVVIRPMRTPIQQHRKHLLKELAARLKRDTQLRYTQRELEMQRLLAGKGGRRKLRGVEEVGAEDNDEDEDETDDGKDSNARSKANEKTYKPRVYKWRIERKR